LKGRGFLFALVSREFKFEMFRGSAHPFQHFQRNPEFPIAFGAHRNRRGSSKPLQHAKIAFSHVAPYAAYRMVSSISEIQSGRFNSSRGLGTAAVGVAPFPNSTTGN
jgi:hypothetical protein